MEIYLILPAQVGSINTQGYQGASLVNQVVYSAQQQVEQAVGGLYERSIGAQILKPIRLTKPLDKSTRHLLNYFHQSQVIPKIEIHECATINKQTQWVTKQTFFNILLSGYDRQVSQNGHFESWVMHYSRYEFGCRELGADHKPGSPAYVGYDLEKGTPS